MRALNGLAEIADAYDGVILDQWGVLHDGVAAEPEAAAVCAALLGLGKGPVLLSNTATTVAFNRAQLERLGLPPRLYQAVVTSGEAMRNLLAARAEPPFDRLGRRAWLVTRDGEASLLEGLDYQVVPDLELADFLLLGSVSGQTVAELEPLLRRAAARGLPCLCANPDLASVGPGVGARAAPEAPGAIAAAYARLGGPVTYVGKPHAPIYEAALASFAGRPERVLAVGDSLHHDIAGGAAMGFDTLLVTAVGVHAPALARGETLAELAAQAGVEPNFVIDRLRW